MYIPIYIHIYVCVYIYIYIYGFLLLAVASCLWGCCLRFRLVFSSVSLLPWISYVCVCVCLPLFYVKPIFNHFHFWLCYSSVICVSFFFLVFLLIISSSLLFSSSTSSFVLPILLYHSIKGVGAAEAWQGGCR